MTNALEISGCCCFDWPDQRMVRPPLQRKESRILKLPAESQKKMMFNVLSALDEMHQGKQAPPKPHHLYIKRSTHSLP